MSAETELNPTYIKRRKILLDTIQDYERAFPVEMKYFIALTEKEILYTSAAQATPPKHPDQEMRYRHYASPYLNGTLLSDIIKEEQRFLIANRKPTYAGVLGLIGYARLNILCLTDNYLSAEAILLPSLIRALDHEMGHIVTPHGLSKNTSGHYHETSAEAMAALCHSRSFSYKQGLYEKLFSSAHVLMINPSPKHYTLAVTDAIARFAAKNEEFIRSLDLPTTRDLAAEFAKHYQQTDATLNKLSSTFNDLTWLRKEGGKAAVIDRLKEIAPIHAADPDMTVAIKDYLDDPFRANAADILDAQYGRSAPKISLDGGKVRFSFT